ncbi:hypothetical protein [Kingella denitrificans]|uniref:hypothetical protein n=1 Tax=Kingella denitrificans TaxID=502 RepID=UPI0028D6EFA3|nr:hypothetical protein [Kingella denitrificans]
MRRRLPADSVQAAFGCAFYWRHTPSPRPMKKAACTSVAGLQAAFCPPNPNAAPHGNAESSLHLPIFC